MWRLDGADQGRPSFRNSLTLDLGAVVIEVHPALDIGGIAGLGAIERHCASSAANRSSAVWQLASSKANNIARFMRAPSCRVHFTVTLSDCKLRTRCYGKAHAQPSSLLGGNE